MQVSPFVVYAQYSTRLKSHTFVASRQLIVYTPLARWGRLDPCLRA